MWLGSLELCDYITMGLECLESPGAPSADERMLDWILASVKSGWIPREVLLWIFSSFWGMLLDMICDGLGSA